jgi:hypothetical protein
VTGSGASRAALFALLLAAAGVEAQDLEPRAYSPAPVGTQFFVAAYSYSSGDLAFDSSVPLEDAQGRFSTAAVAYVRAFGLFGRSAKGDVFLPYVWGNADATLDGNPIGITRAGLADPRVRLSWSFLGAPALTRREFAGYRQGTVAGLSLQVAAPLGQYDPVRRINLGANRFSFRPQLGVSRAAGRLTAEAYVQGVFFTANRDYLVTSTLNQSPILATQAHVSYTLRPRLWVAVDGLYTWGGRTSVDGIKRDDLQKNSRVGAALSLPLARRQSLKLSFSSGLTTRIGGDFDTVGIAYQHAWGG